MDLKSIIAAMPLLRRLWRWMPGPLKGIVLLIALIVAVKRMFGDDEPDGGEGELDPSTDATTTDSGSDQAA